MQDPIGDLLAVEAWDEESDWGQGEGGLVEDKEEFASLFIPHFSPPPPLLHFVLLASS
jgi:hypothetical protein